MATGEAGMEVPAAGVESGVAGMSASAGQVSSGEASAVVPTNVDAGSNGSDGGLFSNVSAGKAFPLLAVLGLLVAAAGVFFMRRGRLSA